MDSQLKKYGEASEVNSDPIGFIDRDNRNHQKKQDYIIETANITGSDTILEVGCGHGLHSPRYEAVSGEYHGIDISPTLVASAREKLDSGSVQAADAHDPPFEANTFDAVVGTAILHHLEDQYKALRSWTRILKDGGVITLMEPNYLFPKDTITAHVHDEEQHKTEMAPWRVRDRLQRLKQDERVSVTSVNVQPRLYTPPWPSRLHGVFDRVDAFCERVPYTRWFSMMLQITVRC